MCRICSGKCLTVYPLFAFSIAGRELDGDSRGYRSAEEQARELTRSIRREVNKLSEQWNALIERSDAWKRKLDDTSNVSTLLHSYLHRKPLTFEMVFPDMNTNFLSLAEINSGFGARIGYTRIKKLFWGKFSTREKLFFFLEYKERQK